MKTKIFEAQIRGVLDVEFNFRANETIFSSIGRKGEKLSRFQKILSNFFSKGGVQSLFSGFEKRNIFS